MSAYFKKTIPIEASATRTAPAGSATTPGQSVLDRNCQSHDVKGLYVVDWARSSPPAPALNPSLTIIAKRAAGSADHLLERFH